jgi:hypothetical protein
MATKALTYVAQSVSLDKVSRKKLSGHNQDWRKLITSQDAEAIWHAISALARSIIPGTQVNCELKSQEVFLHLFASERLTLYIDKDFSDEEITQDLLLLLRD